MSAHVHSVHASVGHGFSKERRASIELVAGQGVRDDAHAGVTVRHRSRVARDPSQPNLRQVHLMHRELFDEVAARGFHVAPGQLGENITTEGIDLLGLPEGALLRIGASAVVRITGLRNPCAQIDAFQRGLMGAVLGKTPDGQVVRKAGVMGVVLASGVVCPGDAVLLVGGPDVYRPLRPV